MSNNSFAVIVRDIVDGFSQYAAEKSAKIGKEVDKIGRETKSEIISTSPVRTVRVPTRSRQTRRVALNPRRQPGAYKAGWASKKNLQGQRVAVSIYNKTNCQLVHLLELGHINRDKATYTSGIPHVKPAEEKGQQALDAAIDRILRE